MAFDPIYHHAALAESPWYKAAMLLVFTVFLLLFLVEIHRIYILSLRDDWESTLPCRVCRKDMRVVTVSQVGIFKSFNGATNYRCDSCDLNWAFGRQPVDLLKHQRFGRWKLIPGPSYRATSEKSCQTS